MSLSPEAKSRVEHWLHGPYDQETKEAILSLNAHDLNEAFGTSLAFGTGGMRGLMGVGTARMNKYTIQMATQGLARYLLAHPQPDKRRAVFIGYDPRHHSEEFAREVACVLAGNGIGALLCSDIRPTPFVSFGVRAKQCWAGIMITASHNPKEYNGYKVYWSDGGQVVFPHDEGIVAEVAKIKDISEIKRASEKDPLIEKVEGMLDDAYLKAIRTIQMRTFADHKVGQALKITYTPIHGTGIKLLPKAFKDWGFSQVNLVDQQIVPDGNFPTVASPNPEKKETLHMGLAQLEASRSDLMLATDPDADRVAVAVMHKGTPTILNGNQIGALCAEYICSTLEEQNKLPANGAIVTSIVSTDLLAAIAKSYGITCVEVLTGFKYIAEQIHLWETSKAHTFLFGAEESYGYLATDKVRDKDAVSSACLIAEIALYMKTEGRTLIDFLEEIYKKYGYYEEGQATIDFPAEEESMEKMRTLMQKLRLAPPKTVAGYTVEVWEDYSTGIDSLPKSDVILMRLSGGGKLTIRPSGTEPKLKIYAGLRAEYNQPRANCSKALKELLEAAKAWFKPS